MQCIVAPVLKMCTYLSDDKEAHSGKAVDGEVEVLTCIVMSASVRDATQLL